MAFKHVRSVFVVVTAMLVTGAAATGAMAGSQAHQAVVSRDSMPGTPQVVSAPGGVRPHVDAIAVLGDTVYAGGLFDAVTQGGQTFQRSHLMAFDRRTGEMRRNFAPVIGGGQVWALAVDPETNSLYVGGQFKTVDGAARAAVAKLDATTGARDPGFQPVFTGGHVNDLEISLVGSPTRKVLVLGGTPGNKLISLNPRTGKNDTYFASKILDGIPGARGGVMVHSFAINPQGTRLVATGNFMTVDSKPRRAFFMMDLGGSRATLADWYYPGFAKPCAATTVNDARRIANLQGIDWSPDGSAFNVAATGRITASPADIWYPSLKGTVGGQDATVCDAVGRFDVDDMTKPVWINYTGGDSIWAVADTGAAVYVAGHFKYMNNPDGFASQPTGDKQAGTPAVRQAGIAAVDPVSGLVQTRPVLSPTGETLAVWNPGLRATSAGGKALVPDASGLWVGNDSTQWNNQPRQGLAFAPLR
jgi:hypothetical protein